MFGIYKYECGLKFIGVVANTEAEAWAYLDKKCGREIGGKWYGYDRSCGAYEVKKVEVVGD